MKISFYDALNAINLTNEEKKSILALNPSIDDGIVTYTVDNRHKLSTTPGRFIKRAIKRLSASEVKLFAEMLCKETSIVITTDIALFEKAYTDIKSCMSYRTKLLPVYLDAGLALAISYIGDKIVGRMLINPTKKTCNTGYGNFTNLSRHLLLNGYHFTESWLDGVVFTPVKVWPFMYLPYLDTPNKLRLEGGKFIVCEGGEYEVQPKTLKVLVKRTVDELLPSNNY